MKNVEVITSGTKVAAYSPIKAQLAEIKTGNANIVFDYENAEDNKRARSYVYQLRKLKALTDKERKAAKAESLAYGRMVDSEAKVITAEIEEMITVHAVPLARIEQRESDRIALIKNKIDAMSMLPDPEVANSSDYSVAIFELENQVIDDSFAEFQLEAAQAKDATLGKLRSLLMSAEKSEVEAAELARLRAEAEARAQKDRDEQIRKDAEEKARADAETKRQAEIAEAEAAHRREIEASERRELELKLERERAEREKTEAIAKAERVERETEERIAKEAAEELAKETAEAEARRSDEKRREKVNAQIAEALEKNGLHRAGIELLITLVADGRIPHMAINY